MKKTLCVILGAITILFSLSSCAGKSEEVIETENLIQTALDKSKEVSEDMEPENEFYSILSELSNRKNIISDAEKSIANNGNISLDMLKKISEAYPQLESAVADYTTGLIDEQNVINKLKDAYKDEQFKYRQLITSKIQLTDEEYNNYIDYLNNKVPHDEQYYQDAGFLDARFVDYMNDNYGVDLANCKNWAEAKIALAELVRSQMASEDANAIIDWETGKVNNQALSVFMMSHEVTDGAKSAVMDIINNYQDAFEEFEKNLKANEFIVNNKLRINDR